MTQSHQQRFRIGLVQMAIGPRREENLARAEAGIVAAHQRGVSVVCLPELFLSPYFCQVEDVAQFDLAESIPGPTTETIGKLAAKLRITVVAPLFERRARGVYYNSAAVLDPAGQFVGLYRKMHIPDDPAYYEKFYFAPGDLGFLTVPAPNGRLGVLICWDQWFPEAARLTALAGADLLFYPTAIGWHPAEKAAVGGQQREAWITIQRSHAIANGVYVAAVNRVGHELPASGDGAGIEFWGSSFVADPGGELIATAPADAEAVLVADVDLDRVEAVRRGWPFLRDRRIDAYGPITQRWISPPAP